MFSFTLCTVLGNSSISKWLIMFACVCNENDAPCALHVRNNLFSELCILGSAGDWLQSASRRHCCRTYISLVKSIQIVCSVLSRIFIFHKYFQLLVFFRPMPLWGRININMFACVCVWNYYSADDDNDVVLINACCWGVQNSELPTQNIEIRFPSCTSIMSRSNAERYFFCSVLPIDDGYFKVH